jgi:hypothetical protein
MWKERVGIVNWLSTAPTPDDLVCIVPQDQPRLVVAVPANQFNKEGQANVSRELSQGKVADWSNEDRLTCPLVVEDFVAGDE